LGTLAQGVTGQEENPIYQLGVLLLQVLKELLLSLSNEELGFLMEKVVTNKDLEEILEFVLAQCRSCGKYYTTKRAINDVLTAYSESVSGFDEEFKEMIYLCPDCRRRELTERFAEASKGETV